MPQKSKKQMTELVYEKTILPPGVAVQVDHKNGSEIFKSLKDLEEACYRKKYPLGGIVTALATLVELGLADGRMPPSRVSVWTSDERQFEVSLVNLSNGKGI